VVLLNEAMYSGIRPSVYSSKSIEDSVSDLGFREDASGIKDPETPSRSVCHCGYHALRFVCDYADSRHSLFVSFVLFNVVFGWRHGVKR
jgi:hypothetical protein